MTQTVLTALAALPRLGAEIGFATAAHPDAQVELLPGLPSTILFSAGGRLTGMVVVPMDESTVRQVLGLPQRQQRNRQFEAFWEADRRDSSLEADDIELLS